MLYITALLNAATCYIILYYYIVIYHVYMTAPAMHPAAQQSPSNVFVLRMYQRPCCIP